MQRDRYVNILNQSDKLKWLTTELINLSILYRGVVLLVGK